MGRAIVRGSQLMIAHPAMFFFLKETTFNKGEGKQAILISKSIK